MTYLCKSNKIGIESTHIYLLTTLSKSCIAIQSITVAMAMYCPTCIKLKFEFNQDWLKYLGKDIFIQF